MQCVIHLLLIYSFLFCLLIPLRLIEGQNNGPYYGQKMDGQSRQKANNVKHQWKDEENGGQVRVKPEYKNQDGLQDSEPRAAHKYSDDDLHQIGERKHRKKEQRAKLQVQVRNARSLDNEQKQETVEKYQDAGDHVNLLQQPIKDNAAHYQQQRKEYNGNYQQPVNEKVGDYIKPRKQDAGIYQQPDNENVGNYPKQQNDNEGNYQQQQGKEKVVNYQPPANENVGNYLKPRKQDVGNYEQPDTENRANYLKQRKDDAQNYQQPVNDNTRNYNPALNKDNYQQGGKENVESYQLPVKEHDMVANARGYQRGMNENGGNQQQPENVGNIENYQQVVKEKIGNYQQPLKDGGPNYEQPRKESAVNYQKMERDGALSLKEDRKTGKKKRIERYRRNEDVQQENDDLSSRNYKNKGNVESLNDNRLEGFKETDLHKLENVLLNYKDTEDRKNKLDAAKLENVHMKDGYNVLPTIDNKLVVQQSQVGLTMRNRSEIRPAESIADGNAQGLYAVKDGRQQDSVNEENRNLEYVKKQGDDALRNKDFESYKKQSALDKAKDFLVQPQDPYGQKKDEDQNAKPWKKDKDDWYPRQKELDQDAFPNKFHPELPEDEQKHKEFHVDTNIAKFGNMESDIAEAQRVIGSDFRQGNIPRAKKKLTKGPARPHPSQRKNVQWMEESQSYNLKLSANDQFRIGYAPIPREGTPWPMPQFYTPGTRVFLLKPENLQLSSLGESCDILEYSIQRAKMNMFGEDNVSSSSEDHHNFHLFREEQTGYPEIKVLNITVLKECGLFPQYDMDESYDLEVRKSGAVLIAREVWGAIRGLETFTQLVYQNEAGQYLVNKSLIHDFPRFKHRGVMLDTSRHYLNKETIIINLEAMAQNKMNVFHWHIVDEQSFPFESKTYPNLTKMGAYSPSHVYTPEMMADIINEARLRGIRVIPEFDTPGHTFSWGLGQDNLLTPCYDYDGEPTGYFGPINPILKSTYKFLQGLFSEVMSIFKDKFIHLGGDEVPMECWQTNPFLERFLTRNHLYEIKDLLNIYMKKLFDIIKGIGKSRTAGSGKIVWQEVFDKGVEIDKDTTVQIWMGDAWDIDRVTSQGHSALFSTCWYLNYISYGMDWDKYYRCEQLGSNLDLYNVRNQSLIMGGEVCLWTEYADDENILPRIWPRASAAAERLWSHKDVQSPQEAAPRLEEQRCRMKRRGIPVGVLSGPGYCKKYSKPQQFKPFTWNSSKKKPENTFETLDLATNKHIYVVDVNSMYLFPLIVLLCVVCLAILISLRHKLNGQKSFLVKFQLPGIFPRRSAKGLVFIFMAFAFVWCIWTAPIWLHTWENKNKPM